MDEQTAGLMYDAIESAMYIGKTSRKHFIWACCKTQLMSFEMTDGTYVPHPSDPEGIGYITHIKHRRVYEANKKLREVAQKLGRGFDARAIDYAVDPFLARATGKRYMEVSEMYDAFLKLLDPKGQ